MTSIIHDVTFGICIVSLCLTFVFMSSTESQLWERMERLEQQHNETREMICMLSVCRDYPRYLFEGDRCFCLNEQNEIVDGLDMNKFYIEIGGEDGRQGDY